MKKPRFKEGHGFSRVPMILRLTQGDENPESVPQICHPDRSEAKWRDLLFSALSTISNQSAALNLSSRPKRSEVEGSAVHFTDDNHR
jgi:hypothetical protein